MEMNMKLILPATIFVGLVAAVTLILLFMTLRPVAEIPRCYADMRGGFYPEIECPQ